MDEYAYEFTIRQLEKIKYSPRGEAHNLSVRLIEALKGRLEEDKLKQ